MVKKRRKSRRRIGFKGILLWMAVVFLLACTLMEQAPLATPAPVETIRLIVNTAIAESETASVSNTSIELATLTASVTSIPAPLATFTASSTPISTLTATIVPTSTPPPPHLGSIGDLYLLPTPSGGDMSGFDTFRIEKAQVVSSCDVASQLCEQGLSFGDPAQATLNASDSVCLFWVEHSSPASPSLRVVILFNGIPQDEEYLQAIGRNTCRAGPISPARAGDYEAQFYNSGHLLSLRWSVR
jgi:hypothetical protein